MKKWGFTTAALTVLSLFCGITAFAEEQTKIEIIHTNDVHGHSAVWPYVKGLANQLRSTNENVSIVDAGDSFAGTAYASLSDGLDVAATMNAVGYEMMTLGNHEYAMSTSMLKGIVEASNFPILGINVEEQTPGLLNEIPQIQGYVIKEYSGIKVAYLGITTSMSQTTSTGQLQGDYRVAIAEQLRDQAAQEGAQLFIALAHLGDTDANETMRSTYLADKCPWLTAIIDGHSHSEHPEGFTRNGVLIAQTGEYGNNIGVMEINVAATTAEVTSKSERLIKVAGNEANTGITPDAEVQTIVDGVNNKNEAYLSEIVFSTPVELIGEKPIVRSQETNFGDIVADAYRTAGNADVAFAASVTIRQNIPAGPVTREVMLSSLGSEQRLLKYEISGQKLWNLMENALSVYPELTNYFQQVSGIIVQFDPSKEAGQRIYQITMSDSSKIDLAKTYSLIIREDMPAITDPTGELEQMPFTAVGSVYPDFLAYAQANSSQFKAEADNRLVVVDMDALKEQEKTTPSSTSESSSSSDSKPKESSTPEPSNSTSSEEKIVASDSSTMNSSSEKGKNLPITGEQTSKILLVAGLLLGLLAVSLLKKNSTRKPL